MIPNILYIGLSAVAGFAVGFGIVSIPGVRNAFKKDSKRFTEKEMQELTDYRKSKFASSNSDYSHTPTHL